MIFLIKGGFYYEENQTFDSGDCLVIVSDALNKEIPNKATGIIDKAIT